MSAVIPGGSDDRLAPRPMNARELIDALHALRQAPRDGVYWQRLCGCLTPLARADSGLVLRFDDGAWQPLCDESPAAAGPLAVWRERADELGGRALQNGFARGSATLGGAHGHIIAAIRLGTSGDTLILLAIPEREHPRLNELLLRIQLVADLPSEVREERPQAVGERPAAGDELLDLLDLVVQVQREQHFGAACLTLVNGLVAHFGCAQAALGWQRGGYVRVQAISHIDRFERTSGEVQLLESALEEALDQDQAIRYPDDHDGGGIVIAHARLMQASGYSQVCSLPLRPEGEAVLWLAQWEGALEPRRLERLRIALGLLLPWLSALRERDRWWGARLAGWAGRRLRPVLGPEHVGRKSLALALSVLLLYVLFGSWQYQVEASARLATDSTVLISAPFDGYVAEVMVSAGDRVAEGEVLAALDTQELYLKQSEIRADLRRYAAEADKARAAGKLVEVEIAKARRAQAKARLERVQYYLRQAHIEAPFDGVVVELQRKDLSGAPVKKGEKLFRLVRIEGLYVVLMVPEEDIRGVELGASGELILLSEPSQSIPIRVRTIIPMAQVKGQEGNHFLVKAEIEQPPEPWWRPGMSGMARIDAGERSILWILTHDLIDALRLRFWW